jgi:hypothetical protein
MNIVITSPENIAAYRLLAIKGALKLESLGMKASGPSALSVVKKEFGIKARTAKEALPLYIVILKEKGILPS